MCIYLSSYDLAVDPMTLILKHDLDILKIYRHTKNEFCRSRVSKVRARTANTALCCCDLDLDLDPMTFIYGLDLNIVDVNLSRVSHFFDTSC